MTILIYRIAVMLNDAVQALFDHARFPERSAHKIIKTHL